MAIAAQRQGGAIPAPLPATTRLVVPRRSDGGRRDELWAFVRNWWDERLGVSLVEGQSPEGPFNRAAAVNQGAEGDWEVLLVLDADVVAEPLQLVRAYEQASQTGRMTLGFERYLALREEMTARVLDGYEGPWEKGVRRRVLNHESSIVAVPRALWETVGGFDERFVGWGQEDVSFAQACRVLGGGIDRVPGDVWHLYHPRSRERDVRLPSYKAAQALGKRYRVTTTKEAMVALLKERDEPIMPVERTRAEVFEDIWRRNGWNGRGTRAGPGSSMRATSNLRAELPRLIIRLRIRSVLDAGCSEALWMPRLAGYVGVDIVPQAIEIARRRHPDMDFRVLDICSDELPRTDLVICRDALQHMSFTDAKAALANFVRSGARWLIASTHRSGQNQDIETGGWHEIDMQAPPFDFSEPLWSIPDGTWDRGVRYPNKVLGLWSMP